MARGGGVRLLPEREGKIFLPEIRPESDRSTTLAVQAIRVSSSRAEVIDILPLRTTASSIILQQPGRQSQLARYGEDLRVVFAGHGERENSVYLIRSGSPALSESTLNKVRAMENADLFALSGEVVTALLAGAV